MRRGELWWAELGPARGSSRAFRRPVLVVQDDAFNRSALDTVLVVPLTTTLRLADAPGNVLLPRSVTSLPADSVALVTAVVAVDKSDLATRVTRLPAASLSAVNRGLRLALGL